MPILPANFLTVNRGLLFSKFSIALFSSVIDVLGRPHPSSFSTVCLPSRNRLCHSKACVLDR